MGAVNKTPQLSSDEFRAMRQKPSTRPTGSLATKVTETDILRSIRDFLRLHGWFVIRNHQGLGSHRGLTDLTAIRGGQVVFIEVKKPGGRLSDDQVRFREDVEAHSGHWLLAYGIEDVEHLAEPAVPTARVWAMIENGVVLCASAVCGGGVGDVDLACPHRAQCVETELMLPLRGGEPDV